MVKDKECIFCKIVNGDIPSEKIYENDNFFVVNDVKPVSEGHCLVISKKHYETLFDLPASLGQELLDAAKKQGLRLIDEGKADGIKLVQNNFDPAGQVVKHFHLHVIPEKSGIKRERQV